MKLVRLLALAIFITLPFIGFYLGYSYPHQSASNTLTPTYQTPAPTTDNNQNGTKLCQTDQDCASNQNCVTPGPVRADPSLNKSYCYNKGTAIPL